MQKIYQQQQQQQDHSNDIMTMILSEKEHWCIIFDVLKELATEAKIYFYPEEKDGHKRGASIFSLNQTKTCAICVTIDANEFEKKSGIFNCKRECSAGICVNSVHKLLSIIDSKSIMKMELKNNSDYMYLSYMDPDGIKSGCFTFTLRDVDDERIQVEADYEQIVTINAKMLHKIVKDFKDLNASYVTITCYSDKVEFSTINNFGITVVFNIHCTRKTVNPLNFNVTNNSLPILKKNYSFSHFQLILKCHKLCGIIKIRMGENQPLFFDLNIPYFGELSICIAPKIDEEDYNCYQMSLHQQQQQNDSYDINMLFTS